MGKRVTPWVLVLLLCFAAAMGVVGYEYDEGRSREREEEREEERGEEREGGQREREEEEERGEERRPEEEDLFLLQDAKHVVKTDAGQMKVVRGFGGAVLEKPMHIGFITMEPKSLYIPQYLDSSLILFIRRGEAKIGTIYRDELVERRLKMGDIYRIPAGSAFYLVNTAEGQRLQAICSIDTSESLGVGVFQSFYIGGGMDPISVLAGFDPRTLATVFNVSVGELKDIMTRQQEGPIVYIADSHSPSVWAKFLELKHHEKQQHLKKMVEFEAEEADHGEEQSTWSWRKLLGSVLRKENKMKNAFRKDKAPDSYNIYHRRPDFKNNYGWSIALHEKDYSPLKHSGIGIYLVNLTAGAMMAPHVNPTATEYGVVLRGSGSVQVVFPNGTSAMNAKVKEGDVFWVPRYFPFCQIASRTGPFEFFGFTTSSRENRPQFLAGASSILQTMRGPELAAAFGVSLEKFDRIVGAQEEAIILPSPFAAPPDMVKQQPQEEEEKMVEIERVPEVIKNLGNEMIMSFD
ncbi:hypothetical protein L1049_013353 [Liquidambar formosana]|uniref:Cupin type-1 domain-containing protein n=1 Tax=Liquidambar formosana TaxID=63359 RepID=A0AAP0RLR6_LIQFO